MGTSVDFDLDGRKAALVKIRDLMAMLVDSEILVVHIRLFGRRNVCKM